MPVMDGEYYKPTYKVPTYRPPTTYKPTIKPQFSNMFNQERPYDKTHYFYNRLNNDSEREKLIREAQVRQVAQEAIRRQQEAVRQLQLQKQDAIDRAAQSRASINNYWNDTPDTLRQSYLSTGVKPGGGSLPSFNQGGYREEPYPASGMLNKRRGVPVNDWNMMSSDWSKMYTDMANWGRGVPSWEEVLAKADPNSHNPWDIAGNPYYTPEDQPIPDSYYPGYGDYGGYGGGSYSSKPGYYGQSSNYGNRWYENLLQWNI